MSKNEIREYIQERFPEEDVLCRKLEEACSGSAAIRLGFEDLKSVLDKDGLCFSVEVTGSMDEIPDRIREGIRAEGVKEVSACIVVMKGACNMGDVNIIGEYLTKHVLAEGVYVPLAYLGNDGEGELSVMVVGTGNMEC